MTESSILTWLEQGHGRIHMVGVCGAGMSGLALLLLDRGFAVDGCDTERPPVSEWPEEHHLNDESQTNDFVYISTWDGEHTGTSVS